MDFEIVSAPPRLVAGRVARTTNADELDERTARLPGLWARAASPGELLAVLTDYESDRDGAYTQLVGRPIEAVGDAGPGELIAHVPAGSYAMFETGGELPAAIVEGWQRVWRAEDAGHIRRAWATDFELWPAGESPRIHASVLG